MYLLNEGLGDGVVQGGLGPRLLTFSSDGSNWAWSALKLPAWTRFLFMWTNLLTLFHAVSQHSTDLRKGFATFWDFIFWIPHKLITLGYTFFPDLFSLKCWFSKSTLVLDVGPVYLYKDFQWSCRRKDQTRCMKAIRSIFEIMINFRTVWAAVIGQKKGCVKTPFREWDWLQCCSSYCLSIMTNTVVSDDVWCVAQRLH